jgi:hypothetical protein
MFDYRQTFQPDEVNSDINREQELNKCCVNCRSSFSDNDCHPLITSNIKLVDQISTSCQVDQQVTLTLIRLFVFLLTIELAVKRLSFQIDTVR